MLHFSEGQPSVLLLLCLGVFVCLCVCVCVYVCMCSKRIPAFLWTWAKVRISTAIQFLNFVICKFVCMYSEVR